MLNERLEGWIKKIVSFHRPRGDGDVFIVATPRGGSTWLAELVSSQPGYKIINEPLSMRKQRIRDRLKFNNWHDLYRNTNKARLQAYLEGLISGQEKVMNHSPISRHYRMFTDRVVVKMIHGGEGMLEWLLDRGIKVVHLLRHPIAVTVSRKELPRLRAFIETDYADNFSSELISYATKIINSGTHNEKGLVSWCFQHYLPLKIRHPGLLRLTYEQLVIEPENVIEAMDDFIGFEDIEAVKAQLLIPSRSVAESSPDTSRAIDQKSKLYLVEKWRSRVGRNEETQLMCILEQFDIDCYGPGSFLPLRYWI